MPHSIARLRVFAAAAALASLVLGSALASSLPEQVEIPSRSRALEHYPCHTCHRNIEEDSTPGAPPRVNTHRGLRFDHMEDAQRCELCHVRSSMNELVLVTGERLHFDASHRLCGQCHGEKLRDWSGNIHGKQVGSWRGKRQRYTCADCHDAHSPRLPKVVAEPPPPRPALGIDKRDTH